jgi:hypothetical protein
MNHIMSSSTSSLRKGGEERLREEGEARLKKD